MTRILHDHMAGMEDFISAGGPLMIPLMVMSILMWGLIINRVFFFRRLFRKNMSRKTALAHVKAAQLPDPRKYRGAVALLVNGFLKRRSGQTGVDRFILDETVVVLTASLNRYLALIAVLAALAPLTGLLGTVTGMIATFDVISIFGTGNARAMAGGISEALITTQTGLLVAIPGLYMSGFLRRRAETLKQRISAVGIYLRRHV